jgi:micrococcal nuclease
MYEYKINKINRIIDGDTLDAEINLGFNITIRQKIRLGGINAPETKTTDLQEKEKGLNAKEWLTKKLNTTEPLKIRTEKEDKYGRILGWIYVGDDNISINNHMIEEGYAKPYMQ